MRRMFKSKIHRATVTHADLDYEGSLSVDRDLMVAANIIPYEEVHVWNVTCGTRLVTYAIEQRHHLHQWRSCSSRKNGQPHHHCDLSRSRRSARFVCACRCSCA